MIWDVVLALSCIILILLVTTYPHIIEKWMGWKEKRSLKKK